MLTNTTILKYIQYIFLFNSDSTDLWQHISEGFFS